jgi:hypothetical protein
VAKAAPEAAPAAATPAGVRSSLLVSLVEQLGQAHGESDRLARQRNVPLVGALVVGVPLVMLMLGFSGGSWFAFAMSVPLLVGLAMAISFGQDRLRQDARKKVEAAAESLTTEFPDAVREWGGPAVLRTPATVSDIARVLGIEEPPPEVPARKAAVTAVAPSPSPTSPAPVEPGQRSALQDKLRPLAEAHAAVAACGQRRPLPLFGALVLSALFLGLPIGLVTGGLYEEYYSPLPFDYYHAGGDKRYDYRGSELTEVAQNLTRHRVIGTAVLLGVVTGVALTGLGTWLLRWWWTYRRLLVLALVGSAMILGVPAAVGTFFLYYGLFGPIYYNSKHYDYRGNELTWVTFNLNERAAIAEGVIIAAGVGLTLVLGVTALLTWRRTRLQARARQAVLDRRRSC